MIETPAQILSHAASADAASSFVAWRKKIRKPLTERAASMILDTLRQIKAAGGEPDKALDLAQEHGWATVKAEWYFKQCPPPAPASKQIPASDRLSKWAESIKTGKPYLCKDIPSTAARELVAAGLVTPDQCKRVSVPL
jgi:hypothetical protein